jgi:hypothetical protein
MLYLFAQDKRSRIIHVSAFLIKMNTECDENQRTNPLSGLNDIISEDIGQDYQPNAPLTESHLK